MNSIAALAFCFSLYRDLRKKGGANDDHGRYWHRSILSSLSARIVGKLVQVPNYQETFLASLLQDLGMLVLSETLRNAYSRIDNEAAQDHRLLEQFEKETFGTDHAEVGAWLAQAWELPEVMKAAVRGSHDPEQVRVPDALRPTIRCVALSARLADLWCCANTEGPSTKRGKRARRSLTWNRRI